MAISLDEYLGVSGEAVRVRETTAARPAGFWTKLERVAGWDGRVPVGYPFRRARRDRGPKSCSDRRAGVCAC